MRPCSKLFLAAVLLISVGLWAQDVRHFRDSNLLARLSYDDTPSLARADGLRQVCVAVSRDGDYRILRSLNNGEPQRLQGKMPQKEFQQLKKLLASPEFRRLSGNHGGLIRRESESFAAEIPMPGEDRAQRLQWLDADGESPFPDSVTKVVIWLKQFEPTDGKLFEYAEYPDVCPSGGVRLLQPSVAANPHP
jgi:hypothetical protein